MLLKNAFGAPYRTEDDVEDLGLWYVDSITTQHGMTYTYDVTEFVVLLTLQEAIQKTYDNHIRFFTLQFFYGNTTETANPRLYARKFVSVIDILNMAMRDVENSGVPPHSFFSKLRGIKIKSTMLPAPEVPDKIPPSVREALSELFIRYVHYGQVIKRGELPGAPPLDLRYHASISPPSPDPGMKFYRGEFIMPPPEGVWDAWETAVLQEKWLGEIRPDVSMRSSKAQAQETQAHDAADLVSLPS